MRVEASEPVKPAAETSRHFVEKAATLPGKVEKPEQPPGEDKETGKHKGVSKAWLEDLVGRLNLVMEMTWYELRFRIHEATHEVVVQVVNRDTGEVLREIPPQKILDMVAEMKKLIGMLVDKKI
ncbi:flagellar protein FlaG [Thermodesulfitimonas sp.]